jgi:hypothetical protein
MVAVSADWIGTPIIAVKELSATSRVWAERYRWGFREPAWSFSWSFPQP